LQFKKWFCKEILFASIFCMKYAKIRILLFIRKHAISVITGQQSPFVDWPKFTWIGELIYNGKNELEVTIIGVYSNIVQSEQKIIHNIDLIRWMWQMSSITALNILVRVFLWRWLLTNRYHIQCHSYDYINKYLMNFVGRKCVVIQS